jgi:hypothetical protein
VKQIVVTALLLGFAVAAAAVALGWLFFIGVGEEL